MKHLFSSGEILYFKNEKKLDKGILKAETLSYDTVAEDTIYEAQGNIDERQVLVRFKIKESCCEELKFKAMIKILMQSELIQADWEFYEIEHV